MSNFKVNNVDIKNPSTFKLERYNITNLSRLANALMVGDLIAQKTKYYFTYEAITARELDVILGAIWSSASIFFPLVFTENGTTVTKSVYVGSIPQELHSAKSSDWVWKGVSFNLIEQ